MTLSGGITVRLYSWPQTNYAIELGSNRIFCGISIIEDDRLFQEEVKRIRKDADDAGAHHWVHG